MDIEELKQHFIEMLNSEIDKCSEPDPKCAFASGMLILLSALKAKDGDTLPLQIAVMHAALREVGEKRGWGVTKDWPKD